MTTLGTPDEQITTVIDTTEHLEVRQRAIAAHASQTSPIEGLPEDLRVAFRGTDHLCRMVRPWTAGRRESQQLASATGPRSA